MTMSEFVVTQWNCKTKTHGLLSASVFFTYFCFVSQNKIMTLTLNKKKTKKNKDKEENKSNTKWKWLFTAWLKETPMKKGDQKASLYHVSWQICTYLSFFSLSPSLSLYKVYLPLALHCSCWTFRGMLKKTKKETVENRI